VLDPAALEIGSLASAKYRIYRVVAGPWSAARVELPYFKRRKSMNRALIAVLAIPLLCGSLLGQPPSSTPAQATATSAPAGSTSRIPPGLVIPVQLLKSIDAKKAKTGDEVTTKVTQDMKNNAGTIVVAKDTQILGHVTEAQARSKEQKESHLTIVFDHAVSNNGEQIQTPMSIQAIVAAPNRNPAVQTFGRDQPFNSAAGGAAGARAGMGGTAAQTPGLKQPQGSESADSQAQQSITRNTQGVLGIPNLKLSAAPDPAQGSLVSSEKENVKLDGGTFLLLRVK
jgi:hypothetical protein